MLWLHLQASAHVDIFLTQSLMFGNIMCLLRGLCLRANLQQCARKRAHFVSKELQMQLISKVPRKSPRKSSCGLSGLMVQPHTMHAHQRH